MGPGDMFGLISLETYATSVRGACYGISAALGKVGAAVRTEAFTPIQVNLGKKCVYHHSHCGVVRMAVTYFFVKDLTSEDLGERDKRPRTYLVVNGWDGEIGEDDLKVEVAADISTDEVAIDQDDLAEKN